MPTPALWPTIALCLGLIAPSAAAACRLPADLAALGQAVLSAVNDERAQKGLPALRHEARLDRAAQTLACDNAAAARLGHTTTDGSTLADRVTGAGYDWGELAENVALGQTGPAAAVADWMASPPHRRNILNRQVTEAGVGIALQADGQAHWVLNLALPR